MGFDQPVGPGGYAWWYIDGMSDDGRHAITLIAFIGSVFSPYYAWAGRSDPLDHCALNVALYGAGGHRWAMTERGRGSVDRGPSHYSVGPSALDWDGSVLTIRIDEVTAPFPSRLRGTVRLRPEALNERSFSLDAPGRHSWWPIAPMARVEVELDRPGLSWTGDGYLDCNRGSEPLEDGFSQWDWCRAPLRRGAAVLYDVTGRDGVARPLALRFDATGACRPFEAPVSSVLPRTNWRVPRATRVDHGREARVKMTLENSPFYARSLISSHLCGEPVTAIHESLALDRFSRPSVRMLLPFKMPRMA